MSHLVFKEKKSYPYIYISNTGDFFMSVPMMGIISNEHITIGADNTCQTAVEFQKAFMQNKIESSIDQYIQDLNHDVKILNILKSINIFSYNLTELSNLTIKKLKKRHQLSSLKLKVYDIKKEFNLNHLQEFPVYPEPIFNLFKKSYNNVFGIKLAPYFNPDDYLRIPHTFSLTRNFNYHLNKYTGTGLAVRLDEIFSTSEIKDENLDRLQNYSPAHKLYEETSLNFMIISDKHNELDKDIIQIMLNTIYGKQREDIPDNLQISLTNKGLFDKKILERLQIDNETFTDFCEYIKPKYPKFFEKDAQSEFISHIENSHVFLKSYILLQTSNFLTNDFLTFLVYTQILSCGYLSDIIACTQNNIDIIVKELNSITLWLNRVFPFMPKNIILEHFSPGTFSGNAQDSYSSSGAIYYQTIFAVEDDEAILLKDLIFQIIQSNTKETSRRFNKNFNPIETIATKLWLQDVYISSEKDIKPDLQKEFMFQIQIILGLINVMFIEKEYFTNFLTDSFEMDGKYDLGKIIDYDPNSESNSEANSEAKSEKSQELINILIKDIKTCLDQQGSITKTCLKYLINLCNEEFRGEFEDEYGYIIQYNTEDDTFDTSTELDSESQTGSDNNNANNNTNNCEYDCLDEEESWLAKINKELICKWISLWDILKENEHHDDLLIITDIKGPFKTHHNRLCLMINSTRNSPYPWDNNYIDPFAETKLRHINPQIRYVPRYTEINNKLKIIIKNTIKIQSIYRLLKAQNILFNKKVESLNENQKNGMYLGLRLDQVYKKEWFTRAHVLATEKGVPYYLYQGLSSDSTYKLIEFMHDLPDSTLTALENDIHLITRIRIFMRYLSTTNTQSTATDARPTLNDRFLLRGSFSNQTNSAPHYNTNTNTNTNTNANTNLHPNIQHTTLNALNNSRFPQSNLPPTTNLPRILPWTERNIVEIEYTLPPVFRPNPDTNSRRDDNPNNGALIIAQNNQNQNNQNQNTSLPNTIAVNNSAQTTNIDNNPTEESDFVDPNMDMDMDIDLESGIPFNINNTNNTNLPFRESSNHLYQDSQTEEENTINFDI